MKIAIATLDGNLIAREPNLASGFVLFEISAGHSSRLEYRANKRSKKSVIPTIRPRDISLTLGDCSAVVAGAIGAHSRNFLENSGLEVIVTNEWLVDRAAALFALTLLTDESRVDPEDMENYPPEMPVFDDGFDA